VVHIPCLSDTSAPATSPIEQEIADVYRAHASGLFHYAVSLLHDGEEARDALQEVFLRYFVERNCGGCVDNPRAWLYRVLRNYLLDCLDTAARKHEVHGSNTDQFPDQTAGPDALIYRAQLASQIRSVLSDRELNCLLLRVEGLSYLEIADVLNLRVGTVGVYLTRAQKKLRGATGQDQDFQAGAAQQAFAFLCHEGAG